MNDALLRWVIRWSVVLGGVVVLATLPLGRLPIFLGALAGASLAVANLWVLRNLVHRMVFQTGRRRRTASILFGLKFLAFIGVLYVVVRFMPMNMPAFFAGISVVVVVIVAGAVVGPPVDAESDDPGDVGPQSTTDGECGVTHG